MLSDDSHASSTGAHPEGVPNWIPLALLAFAVVAAVLGAFILIFS